MSCPASSAGAASARPYQPKDAAIAADLQANEGPIKCTWNFNNSTGTVRYRYINGTTTGAQSGGPREDERESSE